MEPVSQGRGSAHVVAVSLPIRWADVGSFASLYPALPHDGDGNAVVGEVVVHEANGNLVFNGCEGKVALIGVSGLAVVRTAEDVLVVPLRNAELVKQVAADIGT